MCRKAARSAERRPQRSTTRAGPVSGTSRKTDVTNDKYFNAGMVAVLLAGFFVYATTVWSGFIVVLALAGMCGILAVLAFMRA
jgi:hypothetical protein